MCEVRVYIAETEALNDEQIFQRLYEKASNKRQKKIDRLTNRQDKILSLAAECLLAFATKEFGLENILIKEDENGKPYIEDADVCFNLSHSGKRVMCAIGRHEVGCDVQKIKSADIKLAERFFAKSEYESIMKEKEDDRQKLFFRFWTLKESFAKAVGLGLKMPFNSFCIELLNGVRVLQNINCKNYYFREYDVQDGYRYAVCSAAETIGEAQFVDITKEL